MSDFAADKPATGEAHYRPIETVPKGKRCILIAKNGVAILGIFYAEGGFVAWSPLPTKPAWLKKKFEDT